MRKTLERGFGENHCLCHGDLGNLDFLLQARRALADPALAARASTADPEPSSPASTRDGWLCGTRGASNPPA